MADGCTVRSRLHYEWIRRCCICAITAYALLLSIHPYFVTRYRRRAPPSAASSGNPLVDELKAVFMHSQEKMSRRLPDTKRAIALVIGANQKMMARPSTEEEYKSEHDDLQGKYGDRWIPIGKNQGDFVPPFELSVDELGTLSVNRLCRRTSNTCTISFYSHASPFGRGGNTEMGGDPAIQKIEDQFSAGTSA